MDILQFQLQLTKIERLADLDPTSFVIGGVGNVWKSPWMKVVPEFTSRVVVSSVVLCDNRVCSAGCLVSGKFDCS